MTRGRDVDGPSPLEVARPLIDRILAACTGRTAPLFVALDGRSGAGKSTVAAAVAGAEWPIPVDPACPPVTVVEGDQFYGGGSAASWDRQPATVKVDRVIDWRRQRAVLEQLRADGEASWHPFDWDSEDWDADAVPLCVEAVRSVAAPVVLLEGAYSARPELHDVLDLRVLLDTPTDVRRRRLLTREGEEYRADWEARWSAAEAHYFGIVMPPERFDLVLGTA